MSASSTNESYKKQARISTCISIDIKNQAQAKLAKQGMTLSDFLRYAVEEYISGEITVENYLDTEKAMRAKHNVESGKNLKSGTMEDFKGMIRSLK